MADRKHIASLFVKPEGAELPAMSVAAMQVFAFSYLVGWVDACFSSLFTAIERPGMSLAVSLFGTLVFPGVFLTVLTPVFQLTGVWLAVVAASLCSTVLTLALTAARRDALVLSAQ